MNVTTQPSFAGNAVPLPDGWTEKAPASIRDADMIRDGKFVGVVPYDQAPGAGGRPQIRVVLNWSEELKRLAPTK